MASAAASSPPSSPQPRGMRTAVSLLEALVDWQRLTSRRYGSMEDIMGRTKTVDAPLPIARAMGPAVPSSTPSSPELRSKRTGASAPEPPVDWDLLKPRRRRYCSVDDVMARAPVVREYTYYANLLCEICGSGDRDDELLLCDRCDRGNHTFCLRPAVAQVPICPWFCPVCAPHAKEPEITYFVRQEPEFEDVCEDISRITTPTVDTTIEVSNKREIGSSTIEKRTSVNYHVLDEPKFKDLREDISRIPTPTGDTGTEASNKREIALSTMKKCYSVNYFIQDEPNFENASQHNSKIPTPTVDITNEASNEREIGSSTMGKRTLVKYFVHDVPECEDMCEDILRIPTPTGDTTIEASNKRDIGLSIIQKRTSINNFVREEPEIKEVCEDISRIPTPTVDTTIEVSNKREIGSSTIKKRTSVNYSVHGEPEFEDLCEDISRIPTPTGNTAIEASNKREIALSTIKKCYSVNYFIQDEPDFKNVSEDISKIPTPTVDTTNEASSGREIGSSTMGKKTLVKYFVHDVPECKDTCEDILRIPTSSEDTNKRDIGLSTMQKRTSINNFVRAEPEFKEVCEDISRIPTPTVDTTIEVSNKREIGSSTIKKKTSVNYAVHDEPEFEDLREDISRIPMPTVDTTIEAYSEKEIGSRAIKKTTLVNYFVRDESEFEDVSEDMSRIPTATVDTTITASSKRETSSSTIERRNGKKRKRIHVGLGSNIKNLKANDDSTEIWSEFLAKRAFRKGFKINGECQSPTFIQICGFYVTYDEFYDSFKARGLVANSVMTLWSYQFNFDRLQLFEKEKPRDTKFAFYQHITGYLSVDPASFSHEETCKKAYTKINETFPFSKMDMMFFPVISEKHWVLLCVSMSMGQIAFFDSLSASKGTRCLECAQNLIKNFAATTMKYGFLKVDVSAFKWSFPSEYPKQKNLIDCGIYTMDYMVAWNGKEMVASSLEKGTVLEFRKHAAQLLLKSDRNKVKLDDFVKKYNGKKT